MHCTNLKKRGTFRLKSRLSDLWACCWQCCLILLVLSSLATASVQEISIKNGRLSLAPGRRPLKEILTRIVKQTDIRIVVYGNIDRYIDIQINRMPFEDALRRMLDQTAFSFLYKEKKNSHGEMVPVLSEIVIVQSGQGEKQVFQRSSSGLAAGSSAAAGFTHDLSANGDDPAGALDLLQESEPDDNLYGSGVFVEMDREMRNSLADRDLFEGSDTMSAALSPELSRQVEEPEGRVGLEIVTVRKESPAEQIGLKPGDVIREIDGEPVSDPEKAQEKIKNALDQEEPTIVRIEVERENKIEPVYIKIN